jgi:hypothetical protein
VKPDLTHALNTGAMTLIGELAPLLEGTYSSGSLNTLGAMMMIAGLEHERGADTRVQGIGELRELFGSTHGASGTLRDRLAAATAREIENYTISGLDSHLAELKSLLVELQTFAEENSDKELRDRIWAILSADADRNMIGLG